MANNLLADAPFSDEQREWLGRLFSRQDESSPSTSSSGARLSLDPSPTTGGAPMGELLQGCRVKYQFVFFVCYVCTSLLFRFQENRNH